MKSVEAVRCQHQLSCSTPPTFVLLQSFALFLQHSSKLNELDAYRTHTRIISRVNEADLEAAQSLVARARGERGAREERT